MEDPTTRDKGIIEDALRFRAAAYRREASSRKWIGPQYADFRAVLRYRALRSKALADRFTTS